MFEKEASEQANKKYPIPRVCNELDVARNRKYEEGFKDGAEFGYNKANEWYYPSKGELPKEDQEVFVVFTLPDKSKNAVIFTRFKNNDFDLVDVPDVIAWKEIVYPRRTSK